MRELTTTSTVSGCAQWTARELDRSVSDENFVRDNGVRQFLAYALVVDRVVSDKPDVSEIVHQYVAAADSVVGLGNPNRSLTLRGDACQRCCPRLSTTDLASIT